MYNLHELYSGFMFKVVAINTRNSLLIIVIVGRGVEEGAVYTQINWSI